MDKIKQTLNNIIDWIDNQGILAWIAVMVISFIIFWPIGLVVLFFLIWSNRFGKGPKKNLDNDLPLIENSAFEKYKTDTLNRLAQEQKEFEEFMSKLKAAKDQQEFDRFMEQRKATNS